MAETPTFSSCFGENVEISSSGTTAKWVPKHSGGWMYCEKPLNPREVVIVQAEGSGHYDVGFVQKDPKSFSAISGKKASFTQMCVARMHKKTCNIVLKMNTDGTELVSYHNSSENKVNLNNLKSLWVAVYIRYGKMTVSIRSEGSLEQSSLRWSKTHGANIVLNEDSTEAKSEKENPASICFVQEPLQEGDTLVFKVAPISDAGRNPSRFQCAILTCDFHQKLLKEGHRHLFETGVLPKHIPSPLTVIKCLDKHTCEGIVTVTFSEDGIVCDKGPGAVSSVRRPSGRKKKNVWLGFDIYRISIVLLEKARGPANATGTDFVDSVLWGPRNEFAENTFPHLSTQGAYGRTSVDKAYIRHDREQDSEGKSGSDSNLERSGFPDSSKSDCDQTAKKLAYLDFPNVVNTPGAAGGSNLVTKSNVKATNQENGQQRAKGHAPKMSPTNINVTQDCDRNLRDTDQSKRSSDSSKNIENITIPVRVDKLEKTVNLLIGAIQRGLPVGNCQDDALNADPVANTQKNYIALISEIDHVSLSDHLYQTELITEAEMKKVQSKYQTQEDARRVLLEIMRMKSIKKLQLTPMLEAIGQKHLIPLFFP